MSWGFNPETVQAVTTVVALTGVGVGAFLALRQVKATQKAHNAQVLFGLLTQLRDTFLKNESYAQLKQLAATRSQESADQNWPHLMSDVEIEFRNMLKAYDAAGLLIKKGLVNEDVIVEFVWTGVLNRYNDLKPLFHENEEGNSGFFYLLKRCQEKAETTRANAPPEDQE
jgi:hypothetical protein